MGEQARGAKSVGTRGWETARPAAVREDAEVRPEQIRILAVSGSLRSASSNTALLRAVARLAPDNVEVHLFQGLAELPHFNPDLDDFDGGVAPPTVVDLRSRLAASDGVIVACPEYVHGVPGALKNAIDWVVSSGEFYEKPLALLNASMAAMHAYASLTEILTTADAHLVREASVRVGLPTNRIDERGILSDPELSGALQAAVAAFARAIRGRRTETGGRSR